MIVGRGGSELKLHRFERPKSGSEGVGKVRVGIPLHSITFGIRHNGFDGAQTGSLTANAFIPGECRIIADKHETDLPTTLMPRIIHNL